MIERTFFEKDKERDTSDRARLCGRETAFKIEPHSCSGEAVARGITVDRSSVSRSTQWARVDLSRLIHLN